MMERNFIQQRYSSIAAPKRYKIVMLKPAVMLYVVMQYMLMQYAVMRYLAPEARNL